MSVVRSGRSAHDTAVAIAESTRQSAVGAAAVSQATVRTAEIAFYRAARVSAEARGLSAAQFITALQELGTGGN